MSLVSKVKDLLWTKWTIYEAVCQFLSLKSTLLFVSVKRKKVHSSDAFSYNIIISSVQFDNIMLHSCGSLLMILIQRAERRIITANFPLMCPLLYNDAKCSISQWWHEFVITTYRFPSVSWLQKKHTVLTTAPGPITRCGIVSSLPATSLPNELQSAPMGSVFQLAILQRSIFHLLP